MTTTGDPGSGYVLRPGAGWTYARHGFTVKARERDATNGAAVFEFLAPVGQDPPTHVHPTEDEMFYVLGGSFTFQCGGNSFEAERRSFIFLPRASRAALRGTTVIVAACLPSPPHLGRRPIPGEGSRPASRRAAPSLKTGERSDSN
ncbi:MAG: cupin domain-containing protein [Acidimicrobiales bacterium]